MKRIIIATILALSLMLCAVPVYAGVPTLPHAFYGSVSIDGDPAPSGTKVSATVAVGSIVASQNPVTTDGDSYGVGNSPYLLVQGDGLSGAITFYVDGIVVEGVTATFEVGGGPTQRDLSVIVPKPEPEPEPEPQPVPTNGGGGGGGIGGQDTKPPRVYGISVPNISGITATICWTTNEKSTSQVRYWSSPKKVSPFDETYVNFHSVTLVDLALGTTYTYEVMSEDKAGNLTVSDECSFTTLGEAVEPEPVPPTEPEPVPPIEPEPVPPIEPEPVPPTEPEPIEPIEPEPERGMAWYWIVGIVGGLAIAIVGIIYWRRREVRKG